MLNFMGIGAQKCGTTWLFSQLNRHPHIKFPGGKEVHFWDNPRGRTLKDYQQLFSKGSRNDFQGDITPAYSFLPVDVIQEIHDLYPDIPLLYMVRDPKQRAWSSALMALQRAEMTIEEASDQWFIDHFSSKGSLDRGDYETCIRNWLSVYPTDQLLILNFNDIQSDPKRLLERCCHHIGVSPEIFSNDSMDFLKQKVHSGPGYPLRKSLIPVLEEMYREKTSYYLKLIEKL